MKNLLERDKLKRLLFSRSEASRVALKYICSNRGLPLKTRYVKKGHVLSYLVLKDFS